MKRMNIARSIGFPLRKILHCDVTKVFPLFDGVRLVRYKKNIGKGSPRGRLQVELKR